MRRYTPDEFEHFKKHIMILCLVFNNVIEKISLISMFTPCKEERESSFILLILKIKPSYSALFTLIITMYHFVEKLCYNVFFDK